MEYKDRYGILVFSTAYLPHIGGAEVALHEITSRLGGDFDFTLLTVKLSARDKGCENIDGVEIYRLGYDFLPEFINKVLFSFFLAPIKAWQLHKKQNFRLIFALQASFGGLAGLIAKNVLGLKLLVNFQEGNDLKKDFFVQRIIRRLVLIGADSVTAISSHLYRVARILGANDHKIRIIPNGVDLDVFKPVNLEEGFKIREEYGLDKDAKIIITASRLVYKNGIDTLITAFSLLKTKDSLLLVCGDGELLGNYKKMADDLKIADRVMFWSTKNHAELAKIIACADVFVRPSRTEGLGNAFLEAMACGTPIVATNVGGIKDFLKDEITGLRAEVDNPESVANAIDRYFNDDKLYEYIRRKGIELVGDWYGWDKIAQNYKEVFERLVNPDKKKKEFAGKKVLVITQKMDKNDDLLGFFPTWINKMADKAKKIDVITLLWGDYSCPENVDVYSLGKEYSSNRFSRFFKFFYYSSRYSWRKDIIFAHMSPIFAIAIWPFAKLSGAKLVLWYVHRSVTWKLKLAEKLVDLILTTTPESFRLKSPKVRYIGHGIDVDYLKPKYKRIYDKTSPPNFIAVGRLSPIKNYETLIEAMKILRDDGLDFKLTIVGDAVMSRDYEYKNKLIKMVDEYGLSSNIKFIGRIPFSDIVSFYHQSDLAFNMTPAGGLDKAVLEPMACGLPVIISNEAFRPFLGEFAQDLIFCYNNPVDLAKKIRIILNMDMISIGDYLRDMVVQRHSVDKVIENILNG